MIKIDYRLTGSGWSACTLEVNEEKIETSASYLDDALGDLVRAYLKVLEGAQYQKAIFTEEPGEYRWTFTRTNNDDVDLKIISYDDMWLHKPDEEGEVIFYVRVQVQEFGLALLLNLEEIYERHGLRGYKEQWAEHGFPYEEMLKLKGLLIN